MNNEPVAELVLEQMAVGDASSLRVKWLVDNYPPVGTQLYTRPVKELTDEEIEEVIGRHWNKEYGNRNMLTLCRAVLRNAQEKCNGFCGEYECKENKAGCNRKAQKR